MTKIIFVSDLFVEDYVGGAELTSEAIIDKSPFPITKVRSADLSVDLIESNLNSHWMFGNFAFLNDKMIFNIIKSKIVYDVIEYDFKFCIHRSPQKHSKFFGECDCETKTRSKMVSLFFNKARRRWFMSQRQKDVYTSLFPFLDNDKSEVLSSVFKNSTIQMLSNMERQKNDSYIIFKTENWLKGTENAIQFAKQNNLKYELVSNLAYNEMLKKLSDSKGLILMPNAHDTCPRITIEAKLLGCELFLNENVLHAEEEWFANDPQKTHEYLLNNCDKLWSTFSE